MFGIMGGIYSSFSPSTFLLALTLVQQVKWLPKSRGGSKSRGNEEREEHAEEGEGEERAILLRGCDGELRWRTSAEKQKQMK